MPPRPEINRIVRVLLNFHLGGVFLGQTHLDYGIFGIWTFDQDFADELVGDIGGDLLSNDVDGALSDQITIPEWTVQNFDDPDAADLTVTSTFAGGEAGDPLPENVAALVSLRTDRRGRSYRGRCYWPGYTEASADGATFNPTSQGNLADAYDDFSHITSGTWSADLYVISMKLATAEPVTSIQVEGSFATQRPRLERLR